MRLVEDKFGSKLTETWLQEQAMDASNIDAMEMETFRLRNDVVFALNKFEASFFDLPQIFRLCCPPFSWVENQRMLQADPFLTGPYGVHRIQNISYK